MKPWKRTLGMAAMVFGGLSIFACFSPLFPEIGLPAFFIGSASIVTGVWLLSDGRLKEQLRRWARTRQPARRASFDPLLPVEVLRLARKKAGILTMSMVAMELNVSLDQAGAALEECVRRGNAFADYDIERQHDLYRFPEFLPAGDSGNAPAGTVDRRENE
jgi:hypothetical protein